MTHEYRVIITHGVVADSEEEAIQLATQEVGRCSYADIEVELVDEEEAINVVVGVCKEDNPADVDEAYGKGTYERLFPE